MPSISVPLAETDQSVAPTWQSWMGAVMPPRPRFMTATSILTQPLAFPVLSLR
jgi:hypothetical protein